jgi:hypothetical protein
MGNSIQKSSKERQMGIILKTVGIEDPHGAKAEGLVRTGILTSEDLKSASYDELHKTLDKTDIAKIWMWEYKRPISKPRAPVCVTHL